MRWLALLVSALACVFATGCGSVGEPLYPALKIPVRVGDLSAVERGEKLDIRFTIPSQTTEGLVIPQIGNVELRVGPNHGTSFVVNDWAKDAQRVDVVAATPGSVHVMAPAANLVGQDVIVGVRVANTRGRYSEWSNLVTLSVETPLATPVGLNAEATAQGVALTWTAPGISQFRIYRKAGDEREAALVATSNQPSYGDHTAEYGKSYDYYVEGVHEKATSDMAGPASITPKDTFPPAAPTGLTASAGISSIEVAWERNTEPDFKEYRLYRAVGDGPFVQIVPSLTVPSYSDRDIQSGKRYRYRVAAVDQVGNASEPSQPAEATAP